MIIATAVFGNDVYRQMADVLELSVRTNCPQAEFLRFDTEAHQHIKGIPDHCPANAHKKQIWADVVHENQGQEIVLIDCDTIVLRDLQHVFEEHEFDLAYTVRPHRVRVNAGVMFIRSNATSRRFFDKWMYMQQLLLSEEQRPHLYARLRKYAGLDQAAFEHTLAALDFPVKTLELPCTTYNSVDQTWHEFDENTAVLHLKGRLRRHAVIDDDDPCKHPTIEKPMRAWRHYRNQLTSVI